MFEHYLQQHEPDRKRRLRVTIAAHLAALATASGLGFTWLMGKLQIAQVAPPTASFVLVQMSMDTPPPPPPPPPAPARAEPETERQVPDEPQTDLVPVDIIEPLKPPKPRPGPVGNGPPTSTGTAPFGVPGIGIGVPGVNRALPNPGTSVIPRQQDKPSDRVPAALSIVRSQAIYTPDPSRDRLAATRAGMFDKRPGENETGFCVDIDGRTTDVKTIKPFPNDPAVDEVIRTTIKSWRFKPFKIEGRARKTCTSQVFRISFK